MNNRLRWIFLITFVVMPIVNFSVPLWPGSETQFTDDPNTRIRPAGYAFSIWIVIFAGMIAFAWRVLRHEPESDDLATALRWLLIAGLASTAFVPISLYGNSVLGWVDIAVHLVPLVFANLSLRRHVQRHPSTSARWSYFAPSMYLGWISAAFLVINAMAASEQGWTLADTNATVVTCCVLGAIATIAALVCWARDPVFTGTIAWALVAVGVEQAAYPPIRWTAWSAAGLLIAGVVALLLLGRLPYWSRQTESVS